jgi:hypothetical protein
MEGRERGRFLRMAFRWRPRDRRDAGRSKPLHRRLQNVVLFMTIIVATIFCYFISFNLSLTPDRQVSWFSSDSPCECRIVFAAKRKVVEQKL